jgi:hypothetical protein
MSAVDRRLILAARVVTIASLLQAILYGFVGLDNYEWQLRPFILVWMAVPIPLAYWLGTKLARTSASFAIVLLGLLAAFAFAAWAYWEITWGLSRQTESMSGLLFIFAPVYQLVGSAIALAVAAIVGRIRA